MVAKSRFFTAEAVRNDKRNGICAWLKPLAMTTLIRRWGAVKARPNDEYLRGVLPQSTAVATITSHRANTAMPLQRTGPSLRSG